MKIKLINDDCMNIMKDYEDNHFDLAICDPPYTDAFKISANGKAAKVKKDYNLSTLNNSAPTEEYWEELMRVSKNQIIWGINYYHRYFGAGRIVWDKDNTGVYSDCELAYHSFSNVTRKFLWRWNGMLQEDMKNKEERIHPTQKPVKLYEWLLNNYAEKGQKILDTHLGSGSIAIACHYFGVDLVGIEIDKEYYDKAKDRIDKLTRQGVLF